MSASGGNGKYSNAPQTEYGGLGSYTKGVIHLNKGEKIYVYVGGQGENATSASDYKFTSGGFNGGGQGTAGGSNDQAGGGGGATDIRLVSGDWDNQSSLASRIMVASGGGGGHTYATNSSNYGNNRIVFPIINGQSLSYSGTIGQWENLTYNASASQTSGYSFGYGQGYDNLNGTHGAGGGGGGYYGGIANTNGNGGAGAGGTSYISGYKGSIAVQAEDNINPKYGCEDGTTDIECSYHYSGKKFTDTVMKSGDSYMPSHDGLEKMMGNEGNGFARISFYTEDDINEKLFRN